MLKGYNEAVVVDNGSKTIKAGLSGGSNPSSIFPTLVGGSMKLSPENFLHSEEFYVGKEAEFKSFLIPPKCPIDRGHVVNWDDMEKIWAHTFNNELRLDPEDYPILLTEAPLSPKSGRERMTQIMFETFNVPAMYVNTQAVLSLYSTGKTTGCVLESGYVNSYAVPVFDGFAIPYAIIQLEMGGRDLTENMTNLLQERGYIYTNTKNDRKIVQLIKEKLIYVPVDYEVEISRFYSDNNSIRSCALPDGTTVEVGDESIRCPEILFKPPFHGKTSKGISDCTYEAIAKCDPDIWKTLMDNVVMAGGNAMIPSIGKRMKKELAELVPRMKSSVLIPSDVKYSAWIGGSVLANLSTFQDMWVSKEEYDEYGPSIASQKCP